MKKIFSTLFVFASIAFFTSCKNTHQYDKQIKELDSLKIVVEQAIINFKTVDSTTCYEAYSKQFTYAGFINVNLKDTVARSIANDLQTFYLTGTGMVNYLAARSNWLTEAKASTSQLTNLVHDLKNGSVEDEEVIEFITEEKKEAEKIIGELKQNTEVIRNLLQQYNQSLPTAEIVVKKLNNDVLPDIVKPAIKAQIETD
jgi:hypothetical protein